RIDICYGMWNKMSSKCRYVEVFNDGGKPNAKSAPEKGFLKYPFWGVYCGYAGKQILASAPFATKRVKEKPFLGGNMWQTPRLSQFEIQRILNKVREVLRVKHYS